MTQIRTLGIFSLGKWDEWDIGHNTSGYNNGDRTHPQRRVQPDQCYFTVQITGSNFECSL